MNIQDFLILTKERGSMVWNSHLRRITLQWTSSEKNNKNMKLRFPITSWIQGTQIAVSGVPEHLAMNLKALMTQIGTHNCRLRIVGSTLLRIREGRDPLSLALILITSSWLDSNQEALRTSIMISFSIIMKEIVMSTSHYQEVKSPKIHL